MKSVLISYFENYKAVFPKANVSLFEWVTTDMYKAKIEELRKSTNEVNIKKIKSGLPAVTISGRFEKRNVKCLIQHSGFICVDIDGKDNPHINDWNNVKDKLSEISNVAYAGLSASGNGMFVLLPLAYPEKHVEHFTALEAFFLLVCNIKIDQACKDVCRLRGISFDSSPYINCNAEPVTTFLSNRHMTTFKPKGATSESNTAKEIINEILSQKTDITESYKDWFSVGCIIANIYGEHGRKTFHDISQFSTKYNRVEADRQYNACLKTKYPYRIGSLIHIKNKNLT